MTLKRFILGVLTIAILLILSLSLIASWNQPQIQSRLELYQTNLLLHATEWQGETAQGVDFKSARETLIGVEPLKAATKQYEQARQSAQNTLQQLQRQDTQLSPAPEKPLKVTPGVETSISPKPAPLQASIQQTEQLINELDLRLGILQVEQGQTDKALKTWKEVNERVQTQPLAEPVAKTATVLIGLWSNPPRLLPDAQQWINKQLDGWFRYQGLNRLYQLQQREDALSKLIAEEREIAEQAVLKLAVVSAIPTLGFLIGVGLLIFLVGQRLVKGKDSLLAQNEDLPWSTPWDAETIWQVFVVGFFLMGQILVPLAFSLLKVKASSFDVRGESLYVLASYVLVALGGLLVLYFSLKPFLPLPQQEKWFQIDLSGNWFWWGLGGYLTALPLVILVSLINQLVWRGQGGSNPLLPLVLESQDGVALLIFFVTAAVAAPLFEEFLFRGFLLPSLTRYMPVWGAIGASSLLFAVAHLSLSEVLPLTTLGIVLGVVYTRSRNLLAPMLLHSLWNSGTLLSLFILGSGGK
ncbi:MAG TPA: CPBP family intramembrane metalloprotease domain-containing protein [Cyanobacteria bacterium UBA11372]|nr:CPBP family intramembrane metalloprotease domain-containing protein [Cyanobacteria bacterium UBA11372]